MRREIPPQKRKGEPFVIAPHIFALYKVTWTTIGPVDPRPHDDIRLIYPYFVEHLVVAMPQA